LPVLIPSKPAYIYFKAQGKLIKGAYHCPPEEKDFSEFQQPADVAFRQRLVFSHNEVWKFVDEAASIVPHENLLHKLQINHSVKPLYILFVNVSRGIIASTPESNERRFYLKYPIILDMDSVGAYHPPVTIARILHSSRNCG
jgi:hypothetical protein